MKSLSAKIFASLLIGSAVFILAAPGVARAQGLGGVIRQAGRDIDRTANPFRNDSGVRQAGREIDRARLDATAPGFRAGRDYTRLHLHNATSDPISVAIIMVDFSPSQGESRLQEYTGRVDPWQTKAWYNLAPGQKVYIGDTQQAACYLYAIKKGGGRVWEGSSVYRDVRNGNSTMRCGFRMMFVGREPSWTIDLR